MIVEKPFNDKTPELIRDEKYLLNWPVVYLINDNKEYYIGETVQIYNRIKNHLKNPDRRKLKILRILNDDYFNIFATKDIESLLIKYFSAEGIPLQNGNKGLTEHNYYDKEKYQTKFETLWDELKKLKIVTHDLNQLKNSDLFKYSPYKSLSKDQFDIAEDIVQYLKTSENKSIKISGGPGTGKSILAVYLVKYLIDNSDFKNTNIALVVPMTSFRNTLKKVFRYVKGLKSSMVIGPNDVVKESYDILIVDEAHRLKQRKSLTNYGSFDDVNRKLGLKNGSHLDWIMLNSKKQIFFYDENQTVHPSDVDFSKIKFSKRYSLQSQLRVEGGDEYISFIQSILSEECKINNIDFNEYEFKIIDNAADLVNLIKYKNKIEEKDTKFGLSRLIAGFAWDWASKNNSELTDIDIDGVKLRWNSKLSDWVNSENSVNEVGCIHTIQGYDLNYAGVIVGPELSYDFEARKIIIHKDKYKDKKGKASITDENELKKYILNIYKVLLTRGIKGTFVYICDPNLKAYFKSCVAKIKHTGNYQTYSNSKATIAEKTKKYNN